MVIMDQLNLWHAEAFGAVLLRHRNVERVICGHDHRLIVGTFAGKVVTAAPSVAHQVFLALDGDPRFGINLEPPAYLLHRWTEMDGMASHMVYVDRYPGPFPFYAEPGHEWPFPV
jgi:hypothetical protein